jgi:hypothetical protein
MTVYKDYYDRALERAKSKKGKHYKTVRQSTVEPVFGTLINFTGMRKINTRGIESANKVMVMAAIAYNLKKLLKYQGKSLLHRKIPCSVNKLRAFTDVFLTQIYLRIRWLFKINLKPQQIFI